MAWRRRGVRIPLAPLPLHNPALSLVARQTELLPLRHEDVAGAHATRSRALWEGDDRCLDLVCPVAGTLIPTD